MPGNSRTIQMHRQMTPIVGRDFGGWVDGNLSNADRDGSNFGRFLGREFVSKDIFDNKRPQSALAKAGFKSINQDRDIIRSEGNFQSDDKEVASSYNEMYFDKNINVYRSEDKPKLSRVDDDLYRAFGL